MKEVGKDLLQLTKELLALTGHLLVLMAQLLVRGLYGALRFVYRYRLQLLDYKYTPAAVLLICTVWFFLRPKTVVNSVPPQAYAPKTISYAPTSPNPALLAEYTEMTGTLPGARTDLRLSHAIHGWLGTPHCDNGNTRNGTDCSGFVQAIFKEARHIDLNRSAAAIYQEDVRPVKRRKIQEGDLVFFKIGSNHISHVGIFLANGRFAHASTSKGVMVSSLNEPYYKKYFYGAGRVRTKEL